MSIRSVKVSNVSLGAYEQDMKEFFMFSGEIVYVEMHSDNERSQVAYITFRDQQGAETAALLSGATIVDQSVTIELAPDYKLPDNVFATPAAGNYQGDDGYQKAEDVVSSMLARGFIIGKDALNKARDFDDKHQFTSTASAKIASLDQRIGFTDKFNAGTTMVNEKMRKVDHRFQVSEKTKSVFAVAEQSVSNAGSTMMRNPYVSAGAMWFSATFNRVAKAAEDVGQKTREKVIAEEQAQKSESNNAHFNEYNSPESAEHETSELPSSFSFEEDWVLGEKPSNPSSEQGVFLSEKPSNPSS